MKTFIVTYLLNQQLLAFQIFFSFLSFFPVLGIEHRALCFPFFFLNQPMYSQPQGTRMGETRSNSPWPSNVDIRQGEEHPLWREIRGPEVSTRIRRTQRDWPCTKDPKLCKFQARSATRSMLLQVPLSKQPQDPLLWQIPLNPSPLPKPP